MVARFLTHDELNTVTRLAPLVAIDLIIRNPSNEVLLGLRNNEPAKGYFFVPGGIVLKNERLAEAFARILKREVNIIGAIEEARLLGVFDHFYDTNRAGVAGYGTRYVSIAYRLVLRDLAGIVPDDQHQGFRWWTDAELLASEDVHQNTKQYFRTAEGVPV
jgi:colanic acid biosynthesis protein WcaH